MSTRSRKPDVRVDGEKYTPAPETEQPLKAHVHPKVRRRDIVRGTFVTVWPTQESLDSYSRSLEIRSAFAYHREMPKPFYARVLSSVLLADGSLKIIVDTADRPVLLVEHTQVDVVADPVGA
jgi:hypothetical protein